MLKHVRRGAALILSMAMFIQLGIGNNYITFASEESQTPEQTQEESGTTTPETTGEVPEESNDDSTGTQESTEPAPETGNNEVTVPEKEAASTLVVQFVNEDKTNIDVNQYPDKEIALTGLDVNDPYQLVFNDHQINTEIEGYTLSKIVDANDAQKEYPLTTMEQGYVDITLSQNITKLQLVYTKNPEPVQQPDNSQTETDSQQPSEGQEESSEEYGQQDEISQQPTINMLSVGEKVTVQISGVNGVSSTEISTGKVIAPEYSGYAFQYAETTNGTRLDYIGTYNGETYYAYIGDDSDYYFQPATFLTDGEQIRLVYQEVGYQIQTNITGDNKEENNTVDIPEYCNVDGSFSITVSLARGYTASVKVEDKAIKPSQTETNRLTFNVTDVIPGENNVVDVSIKFEKVETYQYWLKNEHAENWHYGHGSGSSYVPEEWPESSNIDSSRKEFKAGEDFTFTIPKPTVELSGGTRWIFNSLAINDEYVTLPGENGTNGGYELSTGTIVTVNANRNGSYNVTVTNAYEDIVVTYGNFRASSWKEVMPNNISGVVLQLYDASTGEWTDVVPGKPLGYESQGEEKVIGQEWQDSWWPWGGGGHYEDVYGYVISFRYKVLDGYSDPQINYTNAERRDDLCRNDGDGYTYFGLVYSDDGDNTGYTNLDIIASYQTYHVTYNEGEQNANVPSDNLDYSISGAEGTYSQINVSNQWPTSNNANFAGWKIGSSSDIVWPGDTLQLQDILRYADNNGNITLTAQWTDKEEEPVRIPYTVNIYLEKEGEPGEYDFSYKEEKSGEYNQIIYLIANEGALSNVIDFDKYELDTNKSDSGAIQLDGENTEFSLYYKLKHFTITTSVVNGKIDEPQTIRYGGDVTINYQPNNGYKIKSVKVDNEDVTEGNENLYKFTNVNKSHTIGVVYEKDENLTHKLSYTVEYYKDNQKVEADTETVEKEVWAGTNELTVDQDKINTTDKYAGYDFVKTDPEQIPATIANGSVIKVFYVRDLSTVTVTPYEGTYDGKGHNVTVNGTLDGDKVEYSTDGTNYTDNLSFIDVTNGTQSIVVEEDSYVLITPAPVTVTIGSATKVYDGTPLTNTKDTTITGLVNGEKVTLTTTGTITNVGSVSNTVTVDWGNVKETNYTVDYNLGTLTVTAQSIDPSDPSYLNVKANKPENKVYDGKDHKWIPEVTLEDGTPLVEGTDYTVTYSTENFKDVQKIKVTIEGTGNYSGTVTRKYRITRKPITVTTDSAIKVYDGSALTADGRVEGIVDGETYGFVITGAQTEVGSSENTYKIEWTGSAKEGNYKITENLGTLTVVPQSIDPEDPKEPEDPDQPVYAGITVDKPEDKVYDGREHKWTPTVTLSDGTVLDPENYEVSYDTEDFVNVTGKITVTITGTGNYAGTVTREYQITPRAITITSADDTKVYDGTPLTNGNVSVTQGSLVSEEDITFKATGSQTEVGSSANTIEVTYANEQMEKNYDVTLVEGTLTVTEKPAEKPEDSDSDKDSEKTDGEDTAAATNVGIFASLATSALAGMGILTALKKRRKN